MKAMLIVLAMMVIQAHGWLFEHPPPPRKQERGAPLRSLLEEQNVEVESVEQRLSQHSAATVSSEEFADVEAKFLELYQFNKGLEDVYDDDCEQQFSTIWKTLARIQCKRNNPVKALRRDIRREVCGEVHKCFNFWNNLSDCAKGLENDACESFLAALSAVENHLVTECGNDNTYACSIMGNVFSVPTDSPTTMDSTASPTDRPTTVQTQEPTVAQSTFPTQMPITKEKEVEKYRDEAVAGEAAAESATSLDEADNAAAGARIAADGAVSAAATLEADADAKETECETENDAAAEICAEALEARMKSNQSNVNAQEALRSAEAAHDIYVFAQAAHDMIEGDDTDANCVGTQSNELANCSTDINEDCRCCYQDLIQLFVGNVARASCCAKDWSILSADDGSVCDDRCCISSSDYQVLRRMQIDSKSTIVGVTNTGAPTMEPECTSTNSKTWRLVFESGLYCSSVSEWISSGALRFSDEDCQCKCESLGFVYAIRSYKSNICYCTPTCEGPPQILEHYTVWTTKEPTGSPTNSPTTMEPTGSPTDSPTTKETTGSPTGKTAFQWVEPEDHPADGLGICQGACDLDIDCNGPEVKCRPFNNTYVGGGVYVPMSHLECTGWDALPWYHQFLMSDVVDEEAQWHKYCTRTTR